MEENPIEINLSMSKIMNPNGVKDKINDIEKLLDETFDNEDSKSDSLNGHGQFGRTAET